MVVYGIFDYCCAQQRWRFWNLEFFNENASALNEKEIFLIIVFFLLKAQIFLFT